MDELDQILERLQAKLGPLEELRLTTLAKRRRAQLIMLIIGCIGIVVTVLLSRVSILAAVIGGIAFLVTLIIIFISQILNPFEKFRSSFKRQFISDLLGAVADDVRYVPTGDQQVLSHYRQSELFPQKPDREQIEDSIFARMGDTDLAVSELHTEYKTTSTDKDGKEETQWHTIFKGLFVSADFHKDFRGKTFVRSDIAEKHFGQFARFVQKPIFSSLELIQLEDPDFEREFVVHSGDQIEARYILSPALMQRMLELKNRFAAKVEFSFLQSRVFIAVSTRRNFFEPQLGQSLHKLETLRDFLDQVRLIMGIVEDLDLNTRIWSKQ